MLTSYRSILTGFSAITYVLCGSPHDPDDGFSTSDLSDSRQHLDDQPRLISNLDHSSLKTTDSSTGYAADTPTDSFPVSWEIFDDHGDDADEQFVSLFASQLLATQKQTNRSTTFMNSPSSTSHHVISSTSTHDPVHAALDWLTSTTTSTSSSGKSASATSKSGASWTASHHTTTTTSTTTTTTTDPAKAAIDWLTSGLEDKSASLTMTTTTTADSKHSSAVSSILLDLKTTHTSAAAADRLRLGFW